MTDNWEHEFMSMDTSNIRADKAVLILRMMREYQDLKIKYNKSKPTSADIDNAFQKWLLKNEMLGPMTISNVMKWIQQSFEAGVKSCYE